MEAAANPSSSAQPDVLANAGPAATPAAVLRGSARGLDLLVDSRAGLDDIEAAIRAKLAEAPGFFRGSDVHVRVDHGPLAVGALARLESLTSEYELRIVEIGAVAPEKPKRERARGTVADAIPEPPVELAAGSAPATVADTAAAVALATATDDVSLRLDAATTLSMPPVATAAPVIAELPMPGEDGEDDVDDATDVRVVVGPVRSGVVLDHRGHLFVFGDVNPGAEVRAEGNIVVLGRLRGIAHAGIGRDRGFIVALRLEPQQLRISRQVARAADSDAGAREPEIAHITGGGIVVERYQGRLPANLAASL